MKLQFINSQVLAPSHLPTFSLTLSQVSPSLTKHARYFGLFTICSQHTLDALRPDYVGGLMCRILHPRPGNAQLLHDPVQESLDVGLGHLVRRAGAAGWSPAHLQAQEEAEQR